ncbi:MAG: PD-(D/E)XK nuclease family protein, partial [Nitrospirae bacterium]
SGYETVLPRVFVQHGIPFVSTLGRALAEFPFIKTAMQLLQLRVAGYRRDHMMDLLSSPFLRLSCLLPQGPLPRPDLWDLASRRLGITKGLDEWRRLTGFQDAGLSLRDDEEGEGAGPRIPAEQIRAAWSVVTALTEAIGDVPETASWAEYVMHVQTLVDRFLDPLAGGAASSASEQPDLLCRAFRDSLGELRELARFGPEVSLLDFVATLRRLVDETTVPVGPTESSRGVGVQVLDAMAARGVPFRALYVLGLNEKVFPRHIQEDAFLRDAPRRFLEADLGFKIQEKLTGFDEEKLLFRLLCDAARDQLTLLYQRTDDAGRMLVPSSYLAGIRSQAGGAEVMVPRRLTRKFEEGLSYRVERLTPIETGIKLLLDRIVPRQLLEVVHPAGRLVMRGLHALRAQETVASTLGAYDGLTGPLASFWLRLKQRGLSPTSLQEYATCPFRYFAGQVLRLDSLVVLEVEDQIGPIELGVLAHGILRACHERLHREGYFAMPSRSSVDPLTVLEEAAHRVFGQFALTHPVGFPVVWGLHQERLLGFLRDVLREDLAELSAGGWEPILFEEPLTGTLEAVGAVETGDPETVSIAGRLDRVDWSAARNAYRIIDYKFKASREPDTLDKNLPLGAVRGLRLQPPLYLAMAGSGMSGRLTQAGVTGCEGEGMTPSAEGVWFYYLAQRWEARHGQALTRAEFPGNAWTAGLREPLERVLRHVLGGIKAGRFFIYPDGYCEHCDYRLTCRTTHQPTSWRARSDHATVRPYRDIRRAKLSDSPADRNVPSSPRTRRPRKPSGPAGEGS